jgi:hypothetical protein
MNENSPIALDELAALMGEDVSGLAQGPFVPEADGHLRLRVALGLVVSGFLGCRTALEPELAIRAAVEAANGCDLDGNKRLVIGWTYGKPAMGWCDDQTPLPETHGGGFGSAVGMPTIVVPADRMLRDLKAAVLALRERRAGVTAH